jgi:hypothetical protein
VAGKNTALQDKSRTADADTNTRSAGIGTGIDGAEVRKGRSGREKGARVKYCLQQTRKN